MYGRLPHEIEGLTPYQLTLAKLIARRWDEHVAGLAQRCKATPVVVLGG